MGIPETAQTTDEQGDATNPWPRGSLWRKWDLHFHTPASFDYSDKSLTDEAIVPALKAAGISAVAITDHHTIDTCRIRQLQVLGGNELTVFPGVELRALSRIL